VCAFLLLRTLKLIQVNRLVECQREMLEEQYMSKILTVDDQPHLTELFSRELVEKDFQVASVGDAESVTKSVRDSKPDLVLLDLYLNGFEGWSVLRDVKSQNPKVPVLIVTAYDSYQGDSRLSMADGYVIKSFVQFDALKQKIAEILE
jgi:DNA-binding response OmpR family regulator